MISSKLIRALRFIAEQLHNQQIRWVLVGSLSLALQGVELHPRDIDILTDKQGAYVFAQIFQAYTHKPVEFKQSTLFESHFGQFKIKGAPVDVMGDLHVKVDNKWTSLTHRLETAKHITIDQTTIPVVQLVDQLETYTKLGRRKDTDRITRIQQALDNATRRSSE